MTNLNNLTKKVIAFRDSRDWKQFHKPKDLALSLVLESSEVLEHFQWKEGKKLEAYLKKNKKEISHELVDVLYWLLTISYELEINLEEAFKEKMEINNKKYPISKFKGRSEKYNQL
jgi:NTP pyrophosphatase (non-canonical NTP hydrolase)